MSEKLKPCPFCGNNPLSARHTIFKALVCVSSGCIIEGIRFRVDDWNSRPIEDALRRQLSETKAQLKTAHGYGSDNGEPPWMK